MRTLIHGLLLCLASCTLLTDAGDRQVDPSIDRDLDFTFDKMDAHASTALDIVLVSLPGALADAGVKKRVRAHARIVLPPVEPLTDYPSETLTLRNVMTPDPEQLLFWADTNDDNEIQYGILTGAPGAEHIWMIPVPDSGIGAFVHSTNFLDFHKDDYSVKTGNLILDLAAGSADWSPADCPNGPDHVLEVRVTIAPTGEQREIGYYKNYGSNPEPSKPIVLEDIIDAGNEFLIESYVDGVLAKSTSARASMEFGTSLTIPQAQWYPAPSDAVCK